MSQMNAANVVALGFLSATAALAVAKTLDAKAIRLHNQAAEGDAIKQNGTSSHFHTKNKWWLAAMIIGIVAASIAGLYMFAHGWFFYKKGTLGRIKMSDKNATASFMLLLVLVLLVVFNLFMNRSEHTENQRLESAIASQNDRVEESNKISNADDYLTAGLVFHAVALAILVVVAIALGNVQGFGSNLLDVMTLKGLRTA